MTGLHHGSERCGQINGEGIAWDAGAFAAIAYLLIVSSPLPAVAARPPARRARCTLSYEYFVTTRDNAGRRSSPRTGVARASRARCCGPAPARTRRERGGTGSRNASATRR